MSSFQHSHILILSCYWLFYFIFSPDRFKIYTSWRLRCLVWCRIHLTPFQLYLVKPILWRFPIKCYFIITQITSSSLLTIMSMQVSFWCKSAFTIRSKDYKKTCIKSTAEIVDFYFCRMLRKWLSYWTHCCYNIGKK